MSEITITGHGPRYAAIKSFDELNIDTVLAKNIRNCQWLKPTLYQQHCFPIISHRRDILSTSYIDNGITGAFSIPIINHLIKQNAKIIHNADHISPQVLIIVPKQKRVKNIYDQMKKLIRNTKLITYYISEYYVGFTVSKILQARCNIIIGTPRSIKDWIDKEIIKLDMVQHIIMKGFNTMINMGQYNDLACIHHKRKCPNSKECQVLIFSDSLPADTQKIAAAFLREGFLFISQTIQITTKNYARYIKAAIDNYDEGILNLVFGIINSTKISNLDIEPFLTIEFEYFYKTMVFFTNDCSINAKMFIFLIGNWLKSYKNTVQANSFLIMKLILEYKNFHQLVSLDKTSFFRDVVKHANFTKDDILKAELHIFDDDTIYSNIFSTVPKKETKKKSTISNNNMPMNKRIRYSTGDSVLNLDNENEVQSD